LNVHDKSGLIELTIAYIIIFVAIVVVNQPGLRLLSTALLVYIGLLLGVPLASFRMSKSNFFDELGLSGITLVSPRLYLTALILPSLLVPFVWPSAAMPTIIFTILVAPFCEEVFFRGYVIHRLRELGTMAVIVVSALLFGFFHLAATQNVVSLLVLTTFGLIYAPIVLVTGSVYPTMLVHAAWNVWVSTGDVAVANTSFGQFALMVMFLLIGLNLALALLEMYRAQRVKTSVSSAVT
jgi:membrane protease YdiL (CAAX protease family)